MEIRDFSFDESPIEHLELHFNESTFGLTEFTQVLDARFAGAKSLRGLEIGTGVGILQARLKERYPDYVWQGVEPVAAGFSTSEAPLERITKKHGLTIHRTKFEDFVTDARFDFIFSLNVLEHVDSWRDCLVKAHSLLRPGGAAVFLCPNYSFPYEPHYALPIILGKRLTHRLFRARIDRHDRRYGTHDLWSSLNFIKKREVIAFGRARGIAISFDESVMTRMVEKLWTDPNFAARQSVLARPAKLLHQLGITELVERAPFNRFSPYAKIVVSAN